MKEEGEPVTLKELAPPPVPESENAALIYQEAFEKIEEVPEDVENLLSKRPSELTSEEKSTIKEFLDANKEGLSILKKATTYKKCRFPVNYEESYYAELPHLGKLRDCAHLLALESLMELDSGNVDEAVNSSLKMVELSEALSTEPIFISQLVRIAIGSTMIRSLEKVLTEGEVPPGTLEMLIDILDKFERGMKRGLKLGLIGERCSFIAAFENPEQFFLKEVDDDIPFNALKYFMRSSFWKNDELYGLKMFGKLIDFAELPPHRAIVESRRLDEEIENRWPQTDDWFLNPWKLREFNILSAMLLPALLRTFENWAHHEAQIRQTKIVATLALYRRKHRAYPEELEEISPYGLPKIPEDPFSGKDFIYKQMDGTFILYSLGKNLKDDGGVAFVEVEGGRKEEADIVWGEWEE